MYHPLSPPSWIPAILGNMPYVLLTIILFAAVYLPSMWVRYVMWKHSRDREDFPGTGGDLARHLIQQYELYEVAVEECEPMRDHYDPSTPAVRLGPKNMNGRSITAVAVAAHEVGHAIQFTRREDVAKLRGRYLPIAALLKRIGVGMIVLVPIVGLVFKAPAVMFVFVGLSLLFQLLGALSYLIILPEEWDASFNKAMPILIDGGYIQGDEIPAVRSVLRAAALTYFSGALADMLNIGRWLMVLIRR